MLVLHPTLFLFFVFWCFFWENLGSSSFSPLHSYSNHLSPSFFWKILVLFPSTNHLSPFWGGGCLFCCFLLIDCFFVSIYICMCGCCVFFLFPFFSHWLFFVVFFGTIPHTHHDVIFSYIGVYSTYLFILIYDMICLLFCG